MPPWWSTGHRAIATLSNQVAHTIEWARCMDALHERGCRVFLELGPGAALSRMLRERFADVDARSLDDFRSLAGCVRWLESRLPSRQLIAAFTGARPRRGESSALRARL